jgi:hypothetical protein
VAASRGPVVNGSHERAPDDKLRQWKAMSGVAALHWREAASFTLEPLENLAAA